MPTIPLAGGFYEDSALQFNSQRCVNMYPVIANSDGGKGKFKLKPVPGLRFFHDEFFNDLVEENLDILGTYYTSKGQFIVTVQTQNITFGEWTLHVFQISSSGSVLFSASAALGLTKSEPSRMTDNGQVLCIVAGGFSFFSDITLGTLGFLFKILDPDFPTDVIDVQFKDTYFIWLDRATDRFYISTSNATDQNDCVNALDFGTVESNPDSIVGIDTIGNEIAIFGSKTIEFFYNSGNIDFPFERNSGATQEIGAISRFCISKINNELYFVGSNSAGSGIVYRMSGYQPERVSTHAIERYLKTSTDINSISSYTHQENGNYFYNVNADGLDSTMSYDLTTGLWHERIRTDLNLEPGNEDCPYSTSFHSFAFDLNMVVESSRFELAFNVFYMDDLFSYVHGFEALRRQRTLQHLSNENKTVQYDEFRMDIQKGVGLSVEDADFEEDIDPVINLSISRDGGMTFGNNITMYMGKDGEYMQRCRAQMLGTARDAVFKLESTAAVQQEWFQAYVTFEAYDD